ncbi:AIRE regulator, partial [Furnarius figulus]|nr:AIRE regulator [Furnarius figulus]
MAGPGGDGDLRRLLKLHRTEIAMAVDDVFPLLHGLADHDVIPDHVFKETLSRAEQEGSHRAFHALLTWLLGRDATAMRGFWAVLFKDYNLERYTRLRPLRSAFPREVELGRQRRGRRLSPSPTAPAPHRPHGKRKAPEEQDKAWAQPSPRHAASPGPLAKAKTVKKPESTPRAGSECCTPRAASACASCLPGRRGLLTPLMPPHLQPSRQEHHLHTQDQLAAPTAYSQDPVPHQENEDECAACGDGGELICCDGCPRAFHLACLVPPLPRVPSGTWRCGSCVTSVAELDQLPEPDTAVQQPPEIPGEEECDTRLSGADGSVCSRCFTRIPTPRHCPAPSVDPRGLLLCTSCMGTLDTGSLDTTTAVGDRPLPAAKVSTTSAREPVGWRNGGSGWGRHGTTLVRGKTSLHPQAEEGALSSDPVLSRDELD